MPAPKKFAPTTANVNKKAFKVRLRNETMALPCSVQNAEQSKGNIGRVSATLIPNQWTEVPECIYDMLKSKFLMKDDVTRMVPDANANYNTPRVKQDEHGETIMREEAKPGYIIEFA